MDARILVDLAQDAVFDVLERPNLPRDAVGTLFEDVLSEDKRMRNRCWHVVVEERLHTDRVVGVDPERHLLFAGFQLCGRSSGEGLEIAFERSGVLGLDRFVVDPAFFFDVSFDNRVPGAVIELLFTSDTLP